MTTPTPLEAAARAFCDEWGYSWEPSADDFDDNGLAPDGEEVTHCRPSQRDCISASRAAILAFIGALDTNDAERKAIGDAFRSGILSVADRDVPFTSDEARNAGARAILTHLKSKVET